MQTWREHMPNGMLLKSDGFASNLSDPGSRFTLEQFCATNQIPYHPRTIPVRLETFTAYGLAFQRRLVPELEETQVSRIEGRRDGYRLELRDGGPAFARNVVVAVGISHFQFLPPTLLHLPPELLSHSSAHKDLTRFRGRSVTVIGAGASAIDLAVLLHEGGADVTLIARRSSLMIHDPPEPGPHSLWRNLRRPSSPIGPGWRSRFYSEAPFLFHHLPESLRLKIASTYLGPAAGWPMKPRFQGNVPVLLGYELQGATAMDGRIQLFLSGRSGLTQHTTDHIIAATGYKVDLRRLTFLSPEILSRVRSVGHTPVLSSTFESSVPGLYFVGAASANSFGPLMRFSCGAAWTATRIAKTLSNSSSLKPVASLARSPVGDIRSTGKALIESD